MDAPEQTTFVSTGKLPRAARVRALVHEALDLYTRLCSLAVSARDLAVVAATLADGGVNPVTRERVVDEGRVGTRWSS